MIYSIILLHFQNVGEIKIRLDELKLFIGSMCKQYFLNAEVYFTGYNIFKRDRNATTTLKSRIRVAVLSLTLNKVEHFIIVITLL